MVFKNSYFRIYVFYLVILGHVFAGVVPGGFTASRVGLLHDELHYGGYLLKNTTLTVASYPVTNREQFGSVITAVMMVSIMDETVREIFNDNLNPTADKFFNAVNKFGDSNIQYRVFGAMFAGGILLNKPSLATLSGELFISYGVSGFITTSVKSLTGRARPFMDKGAYFFTGINNQRNAYYSFPSGHATVSFSSATILAHHTDNNWIKVLWYSAAFMTATARMYKNQHWLSDVTAGGLLGYVVGKTVIKLSELVNKPMAKR